MKHKDTKKQGENQPETPINKYFSVICIDKLAVNYRGKIPKVYGNDIVSIDQNCFIEKTYKLDKNFKNIDKLFIGSREIGTIKYNPQQKFIDKETIHIEFKNSLFYNGYLEQAIKDVGKLFEYNGVSRIEIANDTNNPEFWNFLQGMKWNQKIKYLNKGKQKGKHNVYEDEDRNGETFYFGSAKSYKQFINYIKSKELEIRQKEYINEFHRMNGLTGTVYRTELKLHSTYAKAIDIDKLFDASYLQAVLQEHAKDFLAFYKMRKKRNKDQKYKYWLPIQVFDFESVVEFNKYPEKEVKEKKADDKRLIRELFKSYYAADQIKEKGENLNHLKQILDKTPENQMYFNTNTDRWNKIYNPRYAIVKHQNQLK